MYIKAFYIVSTSQSAANGDGFAALTGGLASRLILFCATGNSGGFLSREKWSDSGL